VNVAEDDVEAILLQPLGRRVAIGEPDHLEAPDEQAHERDAERIVILDEEKARQSDSGRLRGALRRAERTRHRLFPVQ
jgi:hypothetical protein